MTYKQVKPFNQAQGGNIPNFCLYNVCKGYGIANKYSSAWEAWQNTEQHPGGAPDGLDVPVYFSYSATIDGEYRNWGHIGVRLAGGQFWSDGNVYSSIEAYTAHHSPVYVGWGESVNNVQVIKGEEDMATENQIINYYQIFANRAPTQDEIKTYMGVKADVAFDNIRKGSRGTVGGYDWLVEYRKNADAQIKQLEASQGTVTKQGALDYVNKNLN